MQNPRIAVIGASGKVGRAISQQLVRLGYRPVLVSRHAKGLESLSDRADVLNLSMLNVDHLTQALAGADVVLTMIASQPDAKDFLDHQRRQADSQIEAIRRAGVPRVVNLSSNGCHAAEGNGVIQGLTEMEIRLNQLRDVAVDVDAGRKLTSKAG